MIATGKLFDSDGSKMVPSATPSTPDETPLSGRRNTSKTPNRKQETGKNGVDD